MDTIILSLLRLIIMNVNTKFQSDRPVASEKKWNEQTYNVQKNTVLLTKLFIILKCLNK